MLIKILHQELGYGSKKLLAEFPNKAFELIPTVFIVLETCVFSTSSKRWKISQHMKRSSLKFYMQCLN